MYVTSRRLQAQETKDLTKQKSTGVGRTLILVNAVTRTCIRENVHGARYL